MFKRLIKGIGILIVVILISTVIGGLATAIGFGLAYLAHDIRLAPLFSVGAFGALLFLGAYVLDGKKPESKEPNPVKESVADYKNDRYV